MPIGQRKVLGRSASALALTEGPAIAVDIDKGHIYKNLERNLVAKSTLDAAEYLIRVNDPNRFEAWLLQHSPTERAVIVDHIDKKRD